MTRRRARSRLRLTAFTTLLFLGAALAGIDPAAAGDGGCHSSTISEGAGIHVAVRGFCFEPTVLHAERGNTVTWTNHDGVPHAVTGANGVWGSSDRLSASEDVRFRFEEPGTYPYWCVVHPSMLGVVVVSEHGEEDARLLPAETQPAALPAFPMALWVLAAFAAGSALSATGRAIARLVRRGRLR